MCLLLLTKLFHIRLKVKPKVLIAETGDFNSDVLNMLKQSCEVTFENLSKEDLKTALREYDVIWFRLGYKIDKKVLEGDLKCKVLVSPVTGIDHIDEELCKLKGIEIISLKGEVDFLRKVRATAELSIGFAITLMRKIIPASLSVVEGKWNRDDFRGNEIFEKTVGIVGMGRLGSIVADYYKAFGAKVFGYDIADFGNDVQKIDNLEDLIKVSDIVSVHVSHYMNENMFGKKEFELFKKNAILVNTSRGNVMDEEALLEALIKGKLRGAALDVLKKESEITSENPLIKYAKANSNLIILPHIGGNTYESFEKTERFVAEKLINRINSTLV